MSRIAKAPVLIPGGVDIKLEGNNVTVKGTIGQLSYDINSAVSLGITDNVIHVQWDKDDKKAKLLVYYFHLTNRCPTCLSIEANTRKVLNDYFKTQVDNGTIVFKTFNVDLPENKEIAKKYNAYGATLTLTGLSGEKEKIVDLTNFAFSKIHTEGAFAPELKMKIEELLK